MLRSKAIVLETCALFAIIFAVAFWLYSPILSAQLGLIDDHEYFLLLGPGQHLALTDVIPRILNLTEVGHWGESMRFRPFYFLSRGLETSLWGLDPAPRYLSRILILAAFSSALAYIFWSEVRDKYQSKRIRALAFLASAMIGILALSLPTWGDIVLRLGPSEIFLTLALIPFLIGSNKVWENNNSKIGWVSLTIGYCLAVMSKENAVSLLPIVIFLFLRDLRSSRNKVFVVTGIASCIAITAWIEIGINIAMQVNGGDVYGAKRTIGLFVNKLIHEPYIYLSLICLFITVAIELYKLSRKTTAITSRSSGLIKDFPLSLAVIAGTNVLIFDTFVYQAALEPRYFLLSQVALIIDFISVLLAIGSLSRVPEFVMPTSGIIISLLGIVSLNGVWSSQPFQENIRFQATTAYVQTLETGSKIELLVSAMREYPESDVVLYSGTPLMEHSFAVSRIVWFGSGKLLYLAQPFPELQSGNSDLLFHSQTFVPDSNKQPICVTFLGTEVKSDVVCEVVINF